MHGKNTKTKPGTYAGSYCTYGQVVNEEIPNGYTSGMTLIEHPDMKNAIESAYIARSIMSSTQASKMSTEDRRLTKAQFARQLELGSVK